LTTRTWRRSRGKLMPCLRRSPSARARSVEAAMSVNRMVVRTRSGSTSVSTRTRNCRLPLLPPLSCSNWKCGGSNCVAESSWFSDDAPRLSIVGFCLRRQVADVGERPFSGEPTPNRKSVDRKAEKGDGEGVPAERELITGTVKAEQRDRARRPCVERAEIRDRGHAEQIWPKPDGTAPVEGWPRFVRVGQRRKRWECKTDQDRDDQLPDHRG
jgi:hypothetical protein